MLWSVRAGEVVAGGVAAGAGRRAGSSGQQPVCMCYCVHCAVKGRVLWGQVGMAGAANPEPRSSAWHPRPAGLLHPSPSPPVLELAAGLHGHR